RVTNDVVDFIESVWRRGLVDIPGRPAVSAEERRLFVTERPHNQTGAIDAAALEAEILALAVFDLLTPCNLRCRHCYLDFSETDVIPFGDVCDYLDQLQQHGCPEVTFTGGEIFLRRDLLDIIAHAEKRGFFINLLTNGQFITDEMAERLSKHHLQYVQISFYGTTAALHEGVTRKIGSFEKSVKATNYLVARGIPVHHAFFVQRDNFDDAFRFREFAESLRAEASFDSKLVPNRNGSVEPLRHGVTIAQQSELYRRGLLKHNVKMVCTAAVSVCRITARAEVFPCELMNTVSLGNLKRERLADIWRSVRRRKLRQQILDYKPTRCNSCGHVSDCEPCAALRGFGQDGHLDAPVSEACMLTTAGAMSRDTDMSRSPVFHLEEDCIHSLTTSSGARGSHPLVQIMGARAGGVTVHGAS
ncbi:MAG: radical SAM protein, partial [Sulfobacillus sp.]